MIDAATWYAFLPQLFNMSVTASVMILAVLVVRLLLKKSPKIFSYVLWSVVLFRLLCPISVTSDFSLLNIIDAPVTETGRIAYVPSDIVHMENPSAELPVPVVGEAVNNHLPKGEEQLAADPLEFPISAATCIWSAGVIVLVIYSVVQLMRLRRRLVGAMPLRDNIYLADHIDTPFAFGLFRPKIYLPSALPEKERGYIILHEQHHIRRGDHVVKILAFAALCLHWFNPLVWVAFVLSGRDMEMSCDEAVMKKTGSDIRAEYSESLLRFATGKKKLVGTPLAFGEGDTKGRIKNIMKYKKPVFWRIAVAVIICVAAAVCLFTNPGDKKNIAGARYRVEKTIYGAPQLSSVYMAGMEPQYIITSDWVLMERDNRNGSWQTCRELREVTYSSEQLCSLFQPLYSDVEKLLEEVGTVYRADVPGEDSNAFYLVMQTKKKELLLARGYGENLSGWVHWMFQLEKESTSYDSSELRAEIDEMSGKAVTIFSIYESDTLPGWLIAGWQDGSDMGVAYFKYNESQARYVIRGYESFGGASLYSKTIGEDISFDHSITIALSIRRDLAQVTADIGDLHQSAGFFQNCPTMVVFEWEEMLSDSGEKVEVRFFNAASEELER